MNSQKSKHLALKKQKAKHLETLSNRSSDFKPHIEVFKEFHCCQRTEGKGKITRSCKGKKISFCYKLTNTKATHQPRMERGTNY